jgi:hypothetical protein
MVQNYLRLNEKRMVFVLVFLTLKASNTEYLMNHIMSVNWESMAETANKIQQWSNLPLKLKLKWRIS